MQIITFRHQQFNAAIQEEKDLETDATPFFPYSHGKNVKKSNFPGSENEIHTKHLQTISNREYVIPGSWQ